MGETPPDPNGLALLDAGVVQHIGSGLVVGRVVSQREPWLVVEMLVASDNGAAVGDYLCLRRKADGPMHWQGATHLTEVALLDLATRAGRRLLLFHPTTEQWYPVMP